MKSFKLVHPFLAVMSVLQTIMAGVMFVCLCMWSAHCKLFWPLIPITGILLIMSGAASYKALSPEVLRGESQGRDENWPANVPEPSDEDIAFMAEMSNRNTGSEFFENKDASFCASEKTDKVA